MWHSNEFVFFFHLWFSRFIVDFISWIIPSVIWKDTFHLASDSLKILERNRFISSSNTLTPGSRWRRNLKLVECGNLKSKEENEKRKILPTAQRIFEMSMFSYTELYSTSRAAFAWRNCVEAQSGVRKTRRARTKTYDYFKL